jgi:hypothetical protein
MGRKGTPDRPKDDSKDSDDKGDDKADKDDAGDFDSKLEETRPEIGPHVQPRPAQAKSAAKPAGEAKPDELPAITPPDPDVEPWPDATPEPMKPVEPARARTETVSVPASLNLGRPPDMPTSSAPPPLALGAVENPAHMPGPREIPGGEPTDPAPAPGRVPAGDSRSLRRGNEFALIYRLQTFVISRFGTIGTRGQWRVVEYPTSSSASHAYAKEASRFVSEGFSDYRE